MADGVFDYAYIEIDPDTQTESIRRRVRHERALLPEEIKFVGGKPLCRPIVIEQPPFDPATHDLGAVVETIEPDRVVRSRTVIAKPSKTEQVDTGLQNDPVFRAAMIAIAKKLGMSAAEMRAAIAAEL